MRNAASAVPNQRLRRAREVNGWSQEDVAQRIGTDAFTIGRWESGRTRPSPHYRRQLAEVFHLSLVDLGLVPMGDGGADPRAAKALRSSTEARGDVGAATRFTRETGRPPLTLLEYGLIGRDDLVARLKRQLTAGSIGTLMTLNGLPGVGKTALALALARDAELARAFPDGVLWASLGPSPNLPDLLASWGAALGMALPDSRSLTTVEAWVPALRTLVDGRRVLLVVDDAWTLEDALTFKVGGPHCAHLVTTRLADLASQFAGGHATTVCELNEDDGLLLLSRLAPQAVSSEPEAARELVQSVGSLPLALTLLGSHLQVQSRDGQPRRIKTALARLRHTEERLRLAQVQAPLERARYLPPGARLSLHAAIQVSDLHLNLAARMALRALALFPAKPNSFSEEAAQGVLDGTPKALDLLDTLVDAGLVESSGPGRYALHQTIADYARSEGIKGMEGIDDGAVRSMVEHFAAFCETHRADYARLEGELANIIAALDLAHLHRLGAAHVRGALAVTPFLLARGLYTLAQKYLERAESAARVEGDTARCARARHFLEALPRLGAAGDQRNRVESDRIAQAL